MQLVLEFRRGSGTHPTIIQQILLGLLISFFNGSFNLIYEIKDSNQ